MRDLVAFFPVDSEVGPSEPLHFLSAGRERKTDDRTGTPEIEQKTDKKTACNTLPRDFSNL